MFYINRYLKEEKKKSDALIRQARLSGHKLENFHFNEHIQFILI